MNTENANQMNSGNASAGAFTKKQDPIWTKSMLDFYITRNIKSLTNFLLESRLKKSCSERRYGTTKQSWHKGLYAHKFTLRNCFVTKNEQHRRIACFFSRYIFHLKKKARLLQW